MTDLAVPATAEARRPMMGGEVAVHATGDVRRAQLSAVLDRMEAWASRLTRHDPASELMRCNAAPSSRVRVGPTLTAVLDWARAAEGLSDGLVDVAMLDARLAAEAGVESPPPLSASRRWSLDRGPRASTVRREPGVRFDLDGVAKGWLADRALRLLRRYPGAVVDADGDVAVRVAPGDRWEVGVADPRAEGALLAVLVLDDGPGSPGRGRRRWGVATSGTTVHRFGRGAHHLIDPRTGRAAATDVVQATVLASGAAVAEAFAKAAVILGAVAGLDFLDRAGVAGAILLLEDDRVLALPRTMEFLG